MALRRINPQELSGPRAYFTEWAFRAPHTADEDQAQHQQAMRRLKALLLTKTTIVFTASHLDSAVAQQILIENPILLDKGILKPALREGRSSIEEVTADPAMKSFLKDRDITAVSWRQEQGESWFKERLCHELLDANSAICAAIRTSSPTFNARPLVDELMVTEQPIQDVVEHYAGLLESGGKTALQNFRALLYNMSGARVVQCESFLPQENLIDYDFTSLKGRQKLSEEVVLIKVFVEQALKTLNRRSIPIEVLDVLHINEILALREIIEDTGFMREYDNLVTCAISAATNCDPKTSIFHLEQIESSRAKLFENFTLTLEKEFAGYIKSKRISASSSLMSPGISLALGAGGFVLPGIGPIISSLLSLAKDGSGFAGAMASFINTMSVFSEKSNIDASKHVAETRIKILRQSLERRHSGNSMLDVADLYAHLVGEAFKF